MAKRSIRVSQGGIVEVKVPSCFTHCVAINWLSYPKELQGEFCDTLQRTDSKGLDIALVFCMTKESAYLRAINIALLIDSSKSLPIISVERLRKV